MAYPSQGNAKEVSTEKLKTFTYDLSTASGAQAVTGIGFKPRALIAYSTTSGKGTCFGMCDSALGVSCAYGETSYFPNKSDTTKLLHHVGNAGVDEAACVVASLDVDGFTLTWTKTGSITGTATIQVTCFK
jgi:hypothetical protein